jgi:hypothetical protein
MVRVRDGLRDGVAHNLRVIKIDARQYRSG